MKFITSVLIVLFVLTFGLARADQANSRSIYEKYKDLIKPLIRCSPRASGGAITGLVTNGEGEWLKKSEERR